MATISRTRDPHAEGVVAHLSEGGYSVYHRLGCVNAPHRGEPGVRDLIHGPWRYLAAHWRPCQVCRPPADASQVAA